MKKVLAVILVVGLFSCDNSGNVKAELDSAKVKLDTLVNKVERSELVDSIKSKGEKIIDSVKSKGGRFINKADRKIDSAKRNDSTK